MAALASCFNSTSTLFTLDVYAKMYPEKSEAHLVNVGRAFTVFIACVSLAWLPMIDQTNDQLFLYIQAMQVIWCSPIAFLFLGARFLPKMSAFTAWCTLLSGLALGVAFFLCQQVFPKTWLEGSVFHWVQTLNILYFAIVDFMFCGLVLACCHLMEFKGESHERLSLVTRPDIEDVIAKQEWAGLPTKLAAGSLVGVVIAIYIFHELWP